MQAPPVGFGHRGAMADAPENTLESFQLALDMGATGVESDIWLTSDGVPVLDHDGKIGARLRRRNINTVTRSELPDHIPTMEELYGVVGPDFPISLDVKDQTVFEPLIDLARGMGPSAESNLWLCTPHLDLLTDWRPKTEAKLINSVRTSNLSGGLERRAAELQQRSIDGLNLFHSEWNGGRVALLHRFDRMAFGWGAQHSRELAELVDAGIDGLYSDHVDRMMAVIHEYYGPGLEPSEP